MTRRRRINPARNEERNTMKMSSVKMLIVALALAAGLSLSPAPAHAAALELNMVFVPASEKAGKTQEVIPYFIASHPGSDLEAMIE